MNNNFEISLSCIKVRIAAKKGIKAERTNLSSYTQQYLMAIKQPLIFLVDCKVAALTISNSW